MVYESHSPEATRSLAQRFAGQLSAGDCVLLKGTLGVGKTLFCAACLEALGVDGPITSPTFSIANVYDTAATGLRVIHCDFYRLERPVDLLHTGVLDLMEDAITFVEWGDKFDALDYTHAVQIITTEGDSRTIEITEL